MTLPEHRYRGARAMVLLHDAHMRRFLAVWRRARARDLPLPDVADPDYASLASLLRHVVGCARGYMVWACEQLDLPDPDIRPVPDADALEAEVDGYLDHVLSRWRTPLREVSEERFGETFESRWGIVYCIDAMLEHAVMHPIRHTFQLEEWLEGGR